MPHTLLFADNHLDYLNATAALLRAHQYEVHAVSTPSDARHILAENHVDAAILDVRLLDDADERDRSGLRLAKEMQMLCWNVYVPKIILTQVDSASYAREALRADKNGRFLATTYITKPEGFAKLLEAVQEAIAINPVHLRRLLAQHFSESELRTLCFEMRSVDYDDLSGSGKADKARELVTYFERRGRLAQLRHEMYRRRLNLRL